VNIIKNKAEDKRMNEKKALSPPQKRKIFENNGVQQQNKRKKKLQNFKWMHFLISRSFCHLVPAKFK
jgi:hypothetical protein